jgi:two-component system, LuxR family, sensor kinase FixL
VSLWFRRSYEGVLQRDTNVGTGTLVKPAGQIDSAIAGSSLRLARLSVPRALYGGLAAGGLAAAYVLLEWVSSIHEYKGVPITPWNPGLGLAFACMVLGGWRYAIALFVGAVIAEVVVLHSQLAWPVIVGIAAIIAVVYGLVAQLARSNLRLDAGLNRLRDIVTLLLSGAAGAVLVALLVCLLLLADDDLDLGDVLVAAVPLVIGDIIGIAVITPLTLRLVLRPRPPLDNVSLQALAELLLFASIAVAALWLILRAGDAGGATVIYVLFLPVVVAAVRHGVDGACIGLAITQLGLIGMLHGYGYDAKAFTESQLLMLVLSATGLIVGVVVTERRHADEAVRAVELQLKAREAEAAQAARLNLVSGTAAALAHEISQPMTAARALARSVQHILHAPAIDFARADKNLIELIAQVDHAGGVVDEIEHDLLELNGIAEDGWHVGNVEGHRRGDRSASRRATRLRRCRSAPAGRAQSHPQRRRSDRRCPYSRGTNQDGRAPDRFPRFHRDFRCGQWAGHRRRYRRTPVPSADDLQSRRPRPRTVDLRLDRGGTWRTNLARVRPAGCDRVSFLPAVADGMRWPCRDQPYS